MKHDKLKSECFKILDPRKSASGNKSQSKKKKIGKLRSVQQILDKNKETIVDYEEKK
jgi:hypothetical protein